MIKRKYYSSLLCILVFCSHLAVYAYKRQVNLIETIKVTKNKLSVTVNKAFKKSYLKSNFFVEYDPEINLELFDYSIVTMPFIMNVISIIWITGNDYYVDEMDAELYHSLERVKKVFQTMYPETQWNGRLLVGKLVEHNYKPIQDAQERTALLFSGGIDSVSSVFGHLDKKQLLITAWGHWDLPLQEEELWQTRRKKTIKFAKKFYNEATFIKSNYSEFLHWEYLSTLSPEIPKWRLWAVEGIGWAGLTAPILIAKGYPALRIASSHTWLYPYPCAATPYVDDNIRFCGLRLIHDQYNLTRAAKIELIVQTCKERNIKKPFLKICSFERKNDKNCCKCRKCLSSIMGFFAIGADPKDYGMPISLATAWARTKELLAPAELNAYTILYFKGIQQRIQARKNTKKPIPKELLELAAINLDKKIAIEDQIQRKISWNEMRPLLPELEIPLMVDNMMVPR